MERIDLRRGLGVAGLVGLFVAGLAIIHHAPDRAAPVEVPPPARSDDLASDLRRCATLGATDAGAERCAAVWAENSRRFFGRPARPLPTMPSDARIAPGIPEGGAR